MAQGIDYGMGQTNIDHNTGIRYGVIHANDVDFWHESAESQYGDPHCPECGNSVVSSNEPEMERHESAEWFSGKDYTCEDCKVCYWSEDVYPESPVEFTYTNEGYEASQSGDDTDIFVTRSLFYTFAPFCSPCAPGAGYLGNAVETGEDTADLPRVYCFGHNWFDGGKAPYRVFRVSDDTEVLPKA